MALDQFDALLSEQHHKEMMSTFNKLINSIPSVNNMDIISAIDKYGKQVELFTKEISKIKIAAPNITVEKSETVIDQKPIVSSIKMMQDEVVEGLLSLKEAVKKPVEKVMALWEFDVLRNSEGFIITVNAKQIK